MCLCSTHGSAIGGGRDQGTGAGLSEDRLSEDDRQTIGVDQGSEFVSGDLDPWAYAKGATLDFSRQGKPTDNAYMGFNGHFWGKCLNAHWFLTLADAAEKLEDWRR